MTKTEYAEYLNSEHWRTTRANRILWGDGNCEQCKIPRWLAEIAYDQDFHVHHLTYATLGAEQFDDLEVLCRRCHDIETFGRSDLRKVKTATCSICERRHYDPRNNLCPVCDSITGHQAVNLNEWCTLSNAEYASRDMGVMWKMMLWHVCFGLRDDPQCFEVVFDFLLQLHSDNYQRWHKTNGEPCVTGE